jgi:hypothetical protein
LTNITRNYYVGQKLDGTKSLVKLEDYVLLVQHTDGTTLDRKTYSTALTTAFNAYMTKSTDRNYVTVASLSINGATMPIFNARRSR